ncbi:MAG TPA: NrfD/PsrC family molybdoenzyme membrane anchor subunit, partial [Actinomycetota bacterium]|nr:NrfD/PsrC family molybdoenzyme membrane anchor subunit [Actinomycetota bacterium]
MSLRSRERTDRSGGKRAVRTGGGRAERAMVPPAEIRTYYDRPVLKQPVWRWYIPAYLFTGGVAGASSLLALGARVTGNGRLARQSRLLSLGALAASSGLLIADLGRPERFYNMLRVLKPTSPMNVGSWLLSAFGGAVGTGVVCDLLGILPVAGGAADLGAALLGPAVATYTAVLVADTATPAWHEARRELPFVFAAGAAAGAAGLALALAPPSDAGPARALLLGGAAAELASAELLRRRLDPDLAKTYSEGRAGGLSRLARGLTAAGALAVAVGGRRRPVAIAGGVAV